MNWDGGRFRGLAQERGFTLVKLADSLNVSRQTLADWTKGQVPKGSHLVVLSKILSVAPGYFFSEDVASPISVPLHRKRGVAKVTSSMEEASQEMAGEYESLFRSAPAPGIVPILRISRRDQISAEEVASRVRSYSNIDHDKSMDYQHCFDLLAKLRIAIIFRYFPQGIKGYAFYCRIHNHRVVFVDCNTNVLDLIFPLLHETIHAIRDEVTLYDSDEERFCDSLAGNIQFPAEYIETIYRVISERPKSHQVNLLKEFAAKNGHSLFGIVEQMKKHYPQFHPDVGGADSNLRKLFPSVGDILFKDEDPKCYVQHLKVLTPLFFEIVSGQIDKATTRRIGEWLGLTGSLDVREVVAEWRRAIDCT